MKIIDEITNGMLEYLNEMEDKFAGLMQFIYGSPGLVDECPSDIASRIGALIEDGYILESVSNRQFYYKITDAGRYALDVYNREAIANV